MTDKDLLEHQDGNYNDDYNETDDVSTENGVDSEKDTDNGSEWETTDDETSKNTSNFKKLSKAYRKTNSELKKYKKMVEKLQKTDNGDEFDEWNDDLEMRLYFIENPEAKKHKDEVVDILDKYPNMSKEDALTLAKARSPKESDDVNDFDLSSAVRTGKKKIEDLSEEEALKLDMNEYKKWAAKNEDTSSVW